MHAHAEKRLARETSFDSEACSEGELYSEAQRPS